jgi:hypothetical protein
MAKKEKKHPSTKVKGEKQQPTLDDILKGLPIPDEHKQGLTNLLTNLASSVVQSTQEIAAVKTQLSQIETEVSKRTAETYKGLSADQIYQIEIAKASAPAHEAQMQLIQAMVGGTRNPGGGLDQLIADADKLNALRSIFSPQPTPLQVAMEKTQIAQMLAQTRLMNKVAGRETDHYLETLEKGLGEEE